MKKILSNISLMLLAIAALTLNSCRKEDATDDSQSARDAASVSNALNATDDDAVNAAAQVSSISGKTGGAIALNAICGATVTDTGGQEINLSYNGTTNCEGVIRSGSITIQLTSGAHWRDVGAVLTITISNLQITDVATAATYTLQGSYTITNESGGLAYNVFVNGAAGPVVHRHQGNLQVEFANGTSRTWAIDRTRTYTLTSQNYVNIELSSEASGNVESKGTNRFGDNFTNTIQTPIQASNISSCLWKPYVGTYIHQISNRTATVNFGVTINDQPAGATENSCANVADGYFITYQHNGRTLTRFVEYWQ